MKDKTLSHWSENEIIGIDSLLKNDGEVIIFNCYKVKKETLTENFCIPLCETNVDSLEKFNDDIWTSYESLSNEIQINDLYKVFGGEGGMGNEGFVACTDINDNFLWVVFFTNSNPFYKIEFKNNEIYAYSSINLLYKINLINPENIIIEYHEWT